MSHKAVKVAINKLLACIVFIDSMRFVVPRVDFVYLSRLSLFLLFISDRSRLNWFVLINMVILVHNVPSLVWT